MDDDDFFATAAGDDSAASEGGTKRGKHASAMAMSSPPRDGFSVHEALLLALAEQLKVPLELMRSEAVSDEVHFVFSTWRRPYLLLKYLNMHLASVPMRKLYTRFLKALFAITPDCTVESIRYEDVGNRLHLDRFDAELVEAWSTGQTADGEYLPGYSDAQTFLMIGEDTHTCMTIRARQKATNRGLLSIMLNGSCRILGVKDSAGRLLSRSIVRLLLDEDTRQPVLFVETPYGLNEDSEHVEVPYRAHPRSSCSRCLC